ncbi:MAG: hypothetical protein K0R60_2030 [Microbacterium sp.]|nr:hypothetical protein [Microbacterium sp.]
MPWKPGSFRNRARHNGDMATASDPVDAVADELYVLPPEEFTAARNARAKAASGTAAARIKALRKPAVAAWAVNLLVRDGQLAEAVELSAALREAQDDLDAKELTNLGRQRRQLVASLARRAGDLARDHGITLSPSARDAVSATINAAVMDADAAAAVLTGRLLKPIEAGDVDTASLADLVGGSAPDGTPAAPPPSRNDLAERRARKAAEAEARAADEAASRARRAFERSEEGYRTARDRADGLRERLAALEAERERVAREFDDAQTAAQTAERARAALDELTGRRG